MVAGEIDDHRRHPIAQRYRSHLSMLDESNGDGEGFTRFVDLSCELLAVERQTALRPRDEGRISDESLRSIEHELDLDETRLSLSSERSFVEAA
jgi:hypothetical protein